MNDKRLQEAKKGAWLSLLVNSGLAILKGLIGWISGSRALIADAVNSATDVISSLAVLYGIKMAHVPPDQDHPYGHGKAETITALIVAILIAGVAFEVGLSSFQSFFEPITAPSWIAVIAALLSIIVKEGMYRYTSQLAERLNSHAMKANALDHRSDVWATGTVLVGILFSILGQAFHIPYLVYLDPIAGIGVSIFILIMAAKLAKESIHHALDRVLGEDETRELRACAQKVHGVKIVNELLARQHGHYVVVDIKIAVSPFITVEEGHRIGKEVKRNLMLQFAYVSNVMVHVNPYNDSE
ncbi:cation transporter [Hazenella sp. IB182357]|uniref:Cation transporter n=1 Tax=Polycladospora coralii TaxID=2771432 RepID=A0A926N982_9BACL|nr:cation diffusion facilitator family transporter [Polycladospora coralii]MBD1371712.1 cation transporter [Polycladospora coralii]MBS7529179.1 cation transporter [Polycladospora coralii]